MEISEPRKAALYKAISDPIMKRRISVAMSQEVLGAANTKQLDELFYKLEREIWTKVKAALDMPDDALGANDDQQNKKAGGTNKSRR